VAHRTADRVVRVAYTRSQAAEALGISRSTFIRRVLPYIETMQMPWGAYLVPADELDRLLRECRRGPARQELPRPARGRPRSVPDDVSDRILRLRSGELSFGRIAMLLNEEGTPTGHGGSKWWPSTIRSVVMRSLRLGA
jgi:Bacterial regulatory protein, Fis family